MLCRSILSIALVAASLHAPIDAYAADTDDQISTAPTDWAWWRGPNRNGVASAKQSPPMEWSAEKNIQWKVPVSGRGHGSPIVVGDHVYLATADEVAEIQSVLCFDKNSGKQLWITDVHKGGFASSSGRDGNIRSTKASSTIACDGERLFITFLNDDAIHLSALDMAGKQLWQHKVSDYATHQGYGASPAVYGPLVIATADNKGGGAIVAFDRVTGERVWTHKRPKLPNYTSPIILNVAGKDQLIFTGVEKVSSFDPLTGKVNWEVDGATTECVTSSVTDGVSVVTSGGYPDNHISAVKGDGSGELVWRNETRVYVPSMLVHEGYLYVVTDAGMAYCYDMKNGNVKWEYRIRSKFAASPVLVGDSIYATSEDGTTFIFKASPEGFELLAENTLEVDDLQATPAYCDSKIYMRVAFGTKEERKEMLYCISNTQ